MYRTAFLAATVLLFGACLSVGQTPPAAPAVGQKAPGFSLSTPTGQTFTLGSFSRKGPVALIVLRVYPDISALTA